MVRHKKQPKDDTWLEDDVRMIYKLYPRRAAPADDKKAIRKALTRLSERAEMPDPIGWLVGKVQAFAVSPAGQAGTFTPHCATWMNQDRFDADPKEWQRDGQMGSGSNRKPADPRDYRPAYDRPRERIGFSKPARPVDPSREARL